MDAALLSDSQQVRASSLWHARPGGGAESKPLLLRLANGFWQSVPVPAQVSLDLTGVVFSDTATVWAIGEGVASSALLRSRDGGTTWDDVTKLLPDSLRSDAKLVAIGFTDAATGWLVGRTFFGFGPHVARTTNTGADWASVDVGHVALGGRYALGSRNT